MVFARAAVLLVGLAASACIRRPADDLNTIVVSLTNGPNHLDPRMATDDVSQKIHQLPDGDGPQSRFALSRKVSNTEYNRLRSSVIQQDLRDIGIALDVRTYEFATQYADVLTGNFQLFTLQRTAAALADPDILRRVFHSDQAPPAGFNRGRYSNPDGDALLDEADNTDDGPRRLALYSQVQRILADDAPYISLWHKTNVAVPQRNLTGVHLTPLADYYFLKDVARVATATN
jgi:peptide/nickel transport system substrate-binding protein